MYQEIPIITSFPKTNISADNIELVGEKTNNNALIILVSLSVIGVIAIGFYMKNKAKANKQSDNI